MPIDSCTCARCISACKRIPGLFHPVEALRALRAGLASDLMAVWIDNEPKRGTARRQWQVIMPLSAPPPIIRNDSRFNSHHRCEGWLAKGRCIFLNVDGLCEIHDSGFKPMECRHAMLCRSGNADRQHDTAKAAWDSAVGRFVLDLWKRELERVSA